MTNEEILKKAIEIAKDNGWKSPYSQIDVSSIFAPDEEIVQIVGWYKSRRGSTKLDHIDLNTILFDHDFAKAFWGEEPLAICWYCGNSFPETREGYKKHPEICTEIFGNPWNKGTRDVLPSWQHHLQQMVLESEPIKYLEQFLNQ